MKKAPPDNKKIAELEAKIKELEAGWQRTAADFQNYRKRMERDRGEMVRFASSDLVLRLLPVLDNLRRSAGYIPGESSVEVQNIFSGFRAIEQQFDVLLKNHGLERIVVKPGDQFDPVEHEAITHEPHDSIPSDHVIEIVEDGYRLGGRLLRPAKVKVSNRQS